MRNPVPDKNLRVSFSTLACPAWTWSALTTLAGMYEYDGIELRMIEGETDLLARPEFADDVLESNVESLRQSAVQICGLSSSVRFDHLDRAQREEELGVGKLYLDLARRLGAGFVRVFSDVLPSQN